MGEPLEYVSLSTQLDHRSSIGHRNPDIEQDVYQEPRISIPNLLTCDGLYRCRGFHAANLSVWKTLKLFLNFGKVASV